MKRREFITTAVAVGTTLSLRAKGLAVPTPSQIGVQAPTRHTLGNTGIEISRMGFGTGMKGWKRQSEMTRQGFETFVDLFQHCFDREVTFFDLADLYGSHLYCREALRNLPRDQVTLLTKLWWRYDGRKPSEIPAAYRRRSAQTALDRFLQELNTDHIDIVLLHCLQTPKWQEEMEPYMDVLSEAKAKGKVRALGVSCHNFGAMQTAAELPWVDVMLARLNPFGVKTDAEPEEVVRLLQQARDNGKGIIGMKIYGEGQLVDQKERCMEFAQNCGVLDSMTIGTTSRAQVDENLALMARYPAVINRQT